MARPLLRLETFRTAAVAVAVVFLLVVVSFGGSSATNPNAQGLDTLAVALVAVGSATAASSWRAPVSGALATLGVVVVWHRMGYTSALIHVPYLVAFYAVGMTGDRRRQLGAGAIAVALSSVAMLTSDESTGSTAAAVGWTLAALLFGEVTRSHRVLMGHLEARALQAEAERDREAERRVAQTRLAIARDLHDVLAHTVSIMTVQAGVGQDALKRANGAATNDAADALQAIRTAGKDAMAEIQALVSVLRDTQEVHPAPPAPRLDRLDELVEPAAHAGVVIDVDVDLAGESLTDVVELTAYRIIQESITNVVRHADARHVEVSVRLAGRSVDISVRDDGAPVQVDAAGVGFGLRGMRERVDALGGRLVAGPQPDGGWIVDAQIPVDRR